jgi:hypothetical protein
MNEHRRHRRPSRKREELLAQVQGMPAIFHIDHALNLIAYSDTVKAQRFADAELLALIGEAERAGNQTPTRIMQYVMAAKGMDASDKKLCARILFRVKDCRNRMIAKGF